MSPDFEKKIRAAIKTYIPQYEQFVADTFGDIQNISAMIPAFNRAFPSEPKGEKWVTHPDSLRDGNITCDMASVILALWWSLREISSSSFAMHDLPQQERRQIKPHFLVGLMKQKVAPEERNSSYFEQRKKENDELLKYVDVLAVAWLHWTQDGRLQTIGSNKGILTAPMNVMIWETIAKQFATERIRANKLPHTHQLVSKRSILTEPLNSEVQTYYS